MHVQRHHAFASNRHHASGHFWMPSVIGMLAIAGVVVWTLAIWKLVDLTGL
jgi:hypothetical protein